MPMFPLTSLHDDPENVRHVPLSQADIEALAKSMEQIGQLQPIVVRRMDDGTEEPAQYFVTIGRTRVAAARLLDWTEIEGRVINPELGPNEYALASAAENMVRGAMHPVDEWRALKAMTDRGLLITTAADALGITHHYARRLNKLGSMAPAIVEALSKQEDLPQDGWLRLIATAPLEKQEDAFARTIKKRRGTAPIDWWDLAQQCRRTKIPRSLAIFDTETEGVDFSEDLFAEPGSPEQFTTADIKGFMAKQHAALLDRVAKSKGRMVMTSVGDHSQYPSAPAGYHESYEPVPKRWKKDDPRKVAVAIVQNGYNIGKVVERVIIPKAPRKAPDGQGDIDADEAPKPRAPINMPTLAALASMKDAAIVSGVRAISTDRLLHIVLLLFAARNVHVRTSQQQYGAGPIGHLVGKLPDLPTPGQLREAAIGVVDAVIRCDHPKSFAGSGDVANTIAKLVHADDYLARCDTADILKGFSGDALRELARQHGINDHGTVGDVRKRMVGNMPGYKGPGFVSEPIAGELMGDDDEDEDTMQTANEETEA